MECRAKAAVVHDVFQPTHVGMGADVEDGIAETTR
jgi:hypothetical protein